MTVTTMAVTAVSVAGVVVVVVIRMRHSPMKAQEAGLAKLRAALSAEIGALRCEQGGFYQLPARARGKLSGAHQRHHACRALRLRR